MPCAGHMRTSAALQAHRRPLPARAYRIWHNGQMTDYIPTDEELEMSFAQLPKVPGEN